MTHLNVTCRLPFTWAWNYVGEAAVHQCDTFNQTMMMMWGEVYSSISWVVYL